MSSSYTSWGRYPDATQRMTHQQWAVDSLPTVDTSLLPRGAGRSYGDVCLNDGGALLTTEALSHMLAFDAATGLLTCEAGVTIGQMLRFALPRGWTLPVVPGTQHVTLGGAIANDVIGKNHATAGSFGCCVQSLTLKRTTGEQFLCSAEEHADLFAATIGGLGLTGLITSATLQLVPAASAVFDVEYTAHVSPSDCFDDLLDEDSSHPYKVAWMDCLARGKAWGRSIVAAASIAESADETKSLHTKTVPAAVLAPLLTSHSMRFYNAVRYRKQSRLKQQREHYTQYYFPLDGIQNWNHLYSKGLLQYQCALPLQGAVDIMHCVQRERMQPYLVSARACGSRQSPGLMSFAKEGISIALDFPRSAPDIFQKLRKLDEIVLQHGGSLYPAKDARMSTEVFQACFPQWRRLEELRDPGVSSGFWRRVTQ